MPSPAPGGHQRLHRGTNGLGEEFVREKLLQGGMFFGGIAIVGAAIAGSPRCREVGIPIAVLCFILAAAALVARWPARVQRVIGIVTVVSTIGVICWVVAG